ncbi:MAG: hypothetical protein JWN88_853 [Frankiales bacterium]|jgi:hypothetical protein|nr:hypothetical protein [Frankiales bacterium]
MSVSMSVDDERRQLDAVRATLELEFRDRVPAEVVAEHVAQIVARYEDAPVRTFLPVLVGRQARAVLASVA